MPAKKPAPGVSLDESRGVIEFNFGKGPLADGIRAATYDIRSGAIGLADGRKIPPETADALMGSMDAATREAHGKSLAEFAAECRARLWPVKPEMLAFEDDVIIDGNAGKLDFALDNFEFESMFAEDGFLDDDGNCINVYLGYDARLGRVMDPVASVHRGAENFGRTLPVTDAEREIILDGMRDWCMEREGESLDAMALACRAEAFPITEKGLGFHDDIVFDAKNARMDFFADGLKTVFPDAAEIRMAYDARAGKAMDPELSLDGGGTVRIPLTDAERDAALSAMRRLCMERRGKSLEAMGRECLAQRAAPDLK